MPNEDDALHVATTALQTAVRAEQKIDSHDDICELRYRTIERQNKDMTNFLIDTNKKIDNFKWWMMTGIIAVLLTIVGSVYLN